MSYKDVPFGIPEKFNVIIETQQGKGVRYIYDENWDEMKLGFMFKDETLFPFSYGFIPKTHAEDGDHLDAFVLSSQFIQMGTIVECRAIGMIELIDREQKDDKILAVPVYDLGSESIKSLEDLKFDYQTTFAELFKQIGAQRNKTMEIKGYKDAKTAMQELELAHKNFK